MRTCRFGHMYDNFKTTLFKYFKRTPATPSIPTKFDSLSEEQLQKVNEHIQKTVGDGATYKLRNLEQKMAPSVQ